MSASLPSSLLKYHPPLSDTSISANESLEYMLSAGAEHALAHSPRAGAPAPFSEPARWADEVRLSYAARLVFFDLLLRGRAVAGVRSYGQTLGMNERTVRKAIDELVRHDVGELVARGPGLPASLSLTYAVVPTPCADVPHPCAEVRHPTYAAVPPAYADPARPCADVPRPSAETLRLVPPLREVEESFSLIEAVHDGLTPEYRQLFMLEKDAGGRVRLRETLERLARRYDPDVVVATLLARIPATGVNSIVAYLLKQARLLEDGVPLSRSAPPPVPRDHPGPAPERAIPDPALEAAVSYATIQASSITTIDEVASVRRGIELEFSDDARARERALDVFDQVLAR